jgi:hypothetical protein
MSTPEEEILQRAETEVAERKARVEAEAAASRLALDKTIAKRRLYSLHACCKNEQRTMDGGCRNCGDPCL